MCVNPTSKICNSSMVSFLIARKSFSLSQASTLAVAILKHIENVKMMTLCVLLCTHYKATCKWLLQTCAVICLLQKYFFEIELY